jgi:branched-chain amino acid transport system substrate-binding protein
MVQTLTRAGSGLGLVFLVAAASACSSGGSGSTGGSAAGASASVGGPAIVIGTSVSKTGTYASSGTNVANGYQLAVDEINKAGGVLGRQIELRAQDDQSDAGIVGRIYTELLTKDKVDALLSPYGSPLGGPAAQLADRNSTPMVHSQTSSPAVYKDSKWNVMAGLGPSFGVLAGVPAFAKDVGYTKLTLVNNDLTTYKEQCDGVASAITEAGTTLVSRQSYAAATTDFSSIAVKVKQDNPDVVVECSAINDTIGITRALDQQGFRPKMIVSPTAVDANFAKSLGPLADKAVAYSAWAEAAGQPGSADFAKAYQAKYNLAANTQSAGGYAAVQVLAAAIKQAGSTDKKAVNDALHQGTFQTILGTYKVDANGIQSGYTSILLQLQGDAFKVVWPKSANSVAPKLPY